MIAFSEAFTVKKVRRCKTITSVIIQGSLKIRSNNNTNLELAVQSQQTVTLITDTIKKPWFSVCLYRDNCQVLECVYFNDRHCLKNSPQKMYPQHNIRIRFLIYCSAELAASQWYFGSCPTIRRYNTPSGIFSGQNRRGQPCCRTSLHY